MRKGGGGEYCGTLRYYTMSVYLAWCINWCSVVYQVDHNIT